MQTENVISKDVEQVEIPENVISTIIDKLTSRMDELIDNVSPEDDPTADYGEEWTTGNYDGEDWVELDEPFDEYEVSFKYSLSWRYREWTECWTDPVCYPSFDEMDSETGEVYGLIIFTPDGDEVKHSICKRITEKVNNEIK